MHTAQRICRKRAIDGEVGEPRHPCDRICDGRTAEMAVVGVRRERNGDWSICSRYLATAGIGNADAKGLKKWQSCRGPGRLLIDDESPHRPGVHVERRAATDPATAKGGCHQHGAG
jgi:hypothetical protein